jgi:MFS family permease
MPETPRNDPYAALRIPQFRYLITIRFLAILAIMMQAIAVSWQVYALTNDPLSLGLVGLAEALPALSIALFAGHIVDHHDRKTILRIAIGIFTLMAAMLCVVSLLPPLFGTAPFYGAAIVCGIARAFLGPTMFSLTGHVVPKELYSNATTWSTTFWQTGAVLGPLVAGFVYIAGPEWVYGIEVFIFGVVLVLVAGLPAARVRVLPAATPVVRSLLDGVRFVRSQPLIVSALSLDMFAVLFGGAVAMLPVYARDILMVGPVGLGWLRAAPALGAIVVAVLIAHNPPKHHAGKILLSCVAGFGFCIIGFGISTSFILSMVLLFLSGVMDGVSVVLRGTIVQTFTPNEMRGRVASVNMMFIGSSNELGAFESGVAARLMGVVPSVVFGGIMTLVVVAVTAMKSPQLRKLKL